MNCKKHKLLYKEVFTNKLNCNFNDSVNSYCSKPDNSILVDLWKGIKTDGSDLITLRVFISSNKIKEIKGPFLVVLKLKNKGILKKIVYDFKYVFYDNIGKLFFEHYFNTEKESRPFFSFSKKIKVSIFELY